MWGLQVEHPVPLLLPVAPSVVVVPPIWAALAAQLLLPHALLP